MKRILLVCLLGMGLLLPSTNNAAKEFRTNRIIDVYVEQDWLIANSDSYTGTLTKVEIYDTSEEMVLSDGCSGYSCAVDVSELHSGNYMAHVTTTLTTYNEWFSI